MLSELHIQIASKLAVLVVQTRFQTRRVLFQHLHNSFKSVKEANIDQLGHTSHFLHSLLPKDSYRLGEKLIKSQGGRPTASLQVRFILNQRTTGARVHAQHWSIMVGRKKLEHKEEEVRMVAQFFEEMVLILKKIPLLSVYRNDRELKMRYFLENQVLIDKQENPSMFELSGQHFLQRQNETLVMKVKVAYLPSLDDLVPKSELTSPSKRKESATLSDYGDDRRFSIYAFYDAGENFHFLSSDEQEMKEKGPEEKGVELKMQRQESSQEYELLFVDDDQSFAQDNKDLFDGIDAMELVYFPS